MSDYVEHTGRATRMVKHMGAGSGMTDGVGEPRPARLAALLADAQRVMAEVEGLLAPDEQVVGELTAPELAARQAAIIAAAHEEAAAVIAMAHADAARIRALARGDELSLVAAIEETSDDPTQELIDLRDSTATDEHGPVPPSVRRLHAIDAEVSATISTAAEMARSVSSRIDRLSRDLQESPSS